MQHVVAAGLTVSEGATRKLIDLERSMLTSFHQCVEDDKEATPTMRAVMKKAQAGSGHHIVFYEIERVCCGNCAVMYFVCEQFVCQKRMNQTP